MFYIFKLVFYSIFEKSSANCNSHFVEGIFQIHFRKNSWVYNFMNAPVYRNIKYINANIHNQTSQCTVSLTFRQIKPHTRRLKMILL